MTELPITTDDTEIADAVAEAMAQADADAQTPAPEGNDTEGAIRGLTEARDKYLAQRDEARELVARFQRAEVERLASSELSHPSDLLTLSGNTVADYLDDSGNVDASKVEADIRAILLERPGLKPPVRPVDPSQGSMSSPPRRVPTMADLFRSKE